MMTPEELAETLRKIKEQEEAESRDREFAKRVHEEERFTKGERKRAREQTEQESLDAAFAQHLAEEEMRSRKGAGATSSGSPYREESKRKAEFTDTSSDELLARELAKELEARARAKRAATSSKDEEIARNLQAAEGGIRDSRTRLQQFENVRKNRAKISGDAWKIISDKLQEILDSNAMIGDPIDPSNPGKLTDAHKYTRTLIRVGTPVLFDIDARCTLSQDTIIPEQVLTEVTKFLGELTIAPERVTLENIKGTFARIATAPAVDSHESHVNAHHLLSRTWMLAKKLGPAYMGAITTCLSDNIGDQGGCIPGLIARLYAPYAIMIGIELGLTPKVRPTFTTEQQAKAEAEAKAKAEAETKAKIEADARAKAEFEAKTRSEIEEKVKAEAEARAKESAKMEAKAKTEAEMTAKMETEARAKAEAEVKARREAEEARARSEALAKAEAEASAQRAEEARRASAAATAASASTPISTSVPSSTSSGAGTSTHLFRRKR